MYVTTTAGHCPFREPLCVSRHHSVHAKTVYSSLLRPLWSNPIRCRAPFCRLPRAPRIYVNFPETMTRRRRLWRCKALGSVKSDSPRYYSSPYAAELGMSDAECWKSLAGRCCRALPGCGVFMVERLDHYYWARVFRSVYSSLANGLLS